MKVTFYRSATNEKHEPYKSPLLSVDLPDALSRDEAVSKAIRQFEEQMKVANWQALAEFYEIT